MSQLTSQSNTIFILRHGERADNGTSEEKRKISCHHDPHLTQIGKIQATSAGYKLAALIQDSYETGALSTPNPQIVVVSSPFLRCLQTASALMKTFDQDLIYNDAIHVEEGLSEYLSTDFYDQNPMEHIIFNDNRSKINKVYVPYTLIPKFLDEETEVQQPQYPETPRIFFDRVQDSYEKIIEMFNEKLNQNKDKVLVIVSHGLGVKAMLSYHLDYEVTEKTQYTCISQVRIERVFKGAGQILNMMEADHLAVC